MFPETSSPGQHAPVRRAHSTATLLLLSFAVLWCAYWFLRARGYWEDDAWIHLEFARSLAAGRGFSFNGLVVGGDTAPLWVMLLAAAHTVVPEWLEAGKLLAVLGAIFGLTGIYAFARHVAREMLGADKADAFAAAIVLLTAANPYTCFWIFSGMEPIAAAGLACWITLAATHERPNTAVFLAGCALTGLAPLLRPEMLLLAPLLIVPFLRLARRIGASAEIQTAGLLLLAAPLACWSLYSLHAFGHLLPSTFAAKRAAAGESVWLRLVKVYALGLPLLLALPGMLRRVHHRQLPAAATIFLVWTGLTLGFYIVNHTYVQTRYLLLTAPGLMSILLAVLFATWPRTARGIYVFSLGWSALLSLAIVRPLLRNKEANCRNYAQMALFIREQVPTQSPVAVYAIGEIAFLSEHPLVDIGGITRPGALAYLDAGPDAQLQWAKTEGAQYQISGSKMPPETGAEEVYSVAVPFIGWTLDPASYRSSDTLRLWKLAPSTVQSASDSLPLGPD